MAEKKEGFYCQKVVGDANFSIDEWNKQFELCNELEIDMPPEYSEQCKEQCFDCLAIVGETRMKTQILIDKLKIH